MALKHLSEFKNLLGTQQRKRLVLAAAEDINALSAVMKASEDGIIEPILSVGNIHPHGKSFVNN